MAVPLAVTPPEPDLALVREESAQTYWAAVQALAEVAEALNDEELELDALLHLVAARLCQLSGVRRCGLYLKDDRTGHFHGRVGHADRPIDDGIRRLRAGIPADRFTHEIVEKRRPLVMRNACEDPRAVRATMRKWKVRSLLGVPMVLRGQVVGIIFLDDMDRGHDFTPAQQELCAAFAKMAAAAIAQSNLTSDLRQSIETTARQNIALRRAATLEDRLTSLVLEGADLPQIAQAVAELANRPCMIYDGSLTLRATGVPPGITLDTRAGILDPDFRDTPVITDALAALRSKRAGVVGPFPSLAIHHRYLLAPVTARGEQWGYIVLTEQVKRFGQMDAIIARRAATIVALEMSAETRAATAEWDAAESLLSELVRGNRDVSWLQRRADVVGVDLTRPHVVALVSAREDHGGAAPSARAVADAVRREAGPDRDVLAMGGAEGVVLSIALDPTRPPREAVAGAKEILRAACACLAPDGALAAAVSTTCRSAGDYVGAYEETIDLTAVIDQLHRGGGHAVVSVDDLGAGRMLFVVVNGRSADRFVRDTIGPLTDPSLSRGADLLLTLRAFLESARNIRLAAERLHVHENTVRYRLARASELLGLDVASNPEDQLSAQMALLMADLRGAGGPSPLGAGACPD